jgi:probable phosphoglycerate mutase
VTTLLLVRHGESEWNREGRIQGQTDSPLTGLGRAQATEIGKYIAEHLNHLTLIVHSSPLSRATQTASIIAQFINYDRTRINVDQRLNDFDQGEISGTYGWDTVAKQYPELARLRLDDPLRYHPPGGESGADFRARLSDFLTDLDNSDQTRKSAHLVVSHGIVNKYMRSIRRNITGAGVIALDESQYAIYRMDDDRETAIHTDNPANVPVATNH